jgi:hypothetical protein
MIARVAIAIAGAVVVTGALLLAMDTLTSLFENERGERYFRITDVLEKPPPGRPERPQAARRQPEQPEAAVDNPDASVPVDAPDAIEVPNAPVSAPSLELPDNPPK